MPQASPAWLIAGPPEHPLERPDVEVLAGVARGHERDLRRLELELRDAARLDQREDPERLDGRAQVDDVVRVAEGAEHPSVDVDLDDVAPMDALLDPVADLPDEHRRRRRGAASRRGVPRRPLLGRGQRSGRPRPVSGTRPVARRRRMPGRASPPVLGSATASSRTDPGDDPMPLPRTCTSRSTPRSSTSSRSCATRRPSRRSSARSCASCRGCSATRRSPTRACGRARFGRRSRTMAGHELGERIGLIPILRAGLGMVDAMLELMPTAEVWHLGLFRDERTLRPVEYYNKLPDAANVDLCLILDPMLATGGSATAAIEVLKRWGAVTPVRIKLVNLIAAPEGVEAVAQPTPTSRSTARRSTASSTTRATSCPGLGDAGDRQFGTGKPR